MPLDRLALRRRLEQGLEGADAFDASKSMNTYAQGAWGSISDALSQQLRDEEGAQGNTGRFNSGFYDMDRGDIYKTGLRNFGNQIAQKSLDAAEFSADYNARRDDEMYGRTQSLYEHDENDYRDEQERKRKKRSGIGSALGGLLGAGVGALAGGPFGASVGARIGSGVGGAF